MKKNLLLMKRMKKNKPNYWTRDLCSVQAEVRVCMI